MEYRSLTDDTSTKSTGRFFSFRHLTGMEGRDQYSSSTTRAAIAWPSVSTSFVQSPTHCHLVLIWGCFGVLKVIARRKKSSSDFYSFYHSSYLFESLCWLTEKGSGIRSCQGIITVLTLTRTFMYKKPRGNLRKL